MEYVNLGEHRSAGVAGLPRHDELRQRQRPALGRSTRTAAEPIVRAAVDGGVTFFDTADTYSNGASEVATGRLVGKMLSRDEVVIATKVFMPMTPGENGGGLSRKHILSGIDASLRAARHGLRRPLPDPPLGPPHADRGDDGRPARRRAGRQGPLHRGQQHVRLAVRQGPARGRRATAGPASCPCSPTTTSSTARRSGR